MKMMDSIAKNLIFLTLFSMSPRRPASLVQEQIHRDVGFNFFGTTYPNNFRRVLYIAMHFPPDFSSRPAKRQKREMHMNPKKETT